MGADMIIAAVAVRREVADKVDFQAGMDFIIKMSITEEFVRDLVDSGDLWDDEEYFNEDGTPKYPAVREWLLTQHHDFVETLDGRVVSQIQVRDLFVYIVGGMSYGDSPEGCDTIWIMDKVPGLLAAMGFEENYHEVYNPVTPEEEAAAVESIKQANP